MKFSLRFVTHKCEGALRLFLKLFSIKWFFNRERSKIWSCRHKHMKRYTISFVIFDKVFFDFRFSSIWNDVEELWFILIKELIRSAQNDQLVKNSVMQSRLPSKIDDLLSCKVINREIADNYHLFKAFLKLEK